MIYGDAFRLPFFFDDMTHYVWLRTQTLTSIFVSAAGRPYYRPMQFVLWKLYETLFGADSVVVYHALNLLVHVVDAVLVVALVRRLTRRSDRWWPAILAGLIFMLFPFSYQVVTLPASFTHPMAALFVLLTVLAYDRFRETDRRRWLIAAVACGLLAFGSNEGTLLLAGLIALMEWQRDPLRFTRLSFADFKRWQWVIGFGVMAALYYVWYQTRPHETNNGLGLRSLETIFQNAIYTLQGLTFPLQPAGRMLMDTGVSDQTAVLIIAVPTLVVLAVIFAVAKRFTHFIFSLSWFVFCLTPPVLILSHDYFINAPRVLYLGSIGAAWLWAGALEALATARKHYVLQRIVAFAAAALVLGSSLVFIRQRMDLHDLNAVPLNQALQAAERSKPDETLLFVNLPAWISTPQLWYPIGHEGALFMPSYSSMAEFVSTNLNRPSKDVAVEFNSLSTPQAYYYGVYGPALSWEQLTPQVRSASRVYFTRYAPDAIELVEAGRLLKQPEPSSVPTANFGSTIQLELAKWAVCDDQLTVRLSWRALQTTSADWHVFVHVLKPDGSLAAQHDSPPLMGLLPFWQWLAGDRVSDVHPIDLDQLSRDEVHTIAIGLYDPATGERLIATLADRTQPADRAVRIGTFTPGYDQCH
ncbi:MAG: hypothetical protein U0559_07490 [Anaerolineae bacterium]